ncbi:MAG: proton-conducting transporter membrane subunit [Campylobacterota bacterium]|nr:proton-conducting transporter membrane subunit [Campylobacterota bacterium]
MSLVYFIALPILASFLTPLYKNYLRYISVLLNIILLYIAFSFSSLLPLTQYIGFDSALSISFILDKASLFFVSLFILVMLLFSIFNLKEKSNKAIFILTNLLLAGVLGLVLSGDIFNIYIFFEIASVSAYILTTLNKDKLAYSGAIRYMIIGSIASIFLLLAIMLIYLNIGSLNLIAISKEFSTIDEKIQFLILLSLFIGFGIKAEIFPLNFWVPDIYQASSSKVASLFSSILSKSYIFVFFHIAYILQIDSKYFNFLVILGLISFIISEISALSSKETKRVFAYSTLGQLGILFLAFSYGDVDILTGAIFLVAIHSITKLMLFLSLDILETRFNSTKTEIFKQFNSLFLTIIFAIGFLSLLGIPPFGGFIAKLTILKGLASLQEYLIIGIILVISLVEAVYFFRLLGYTRETTDINKKDIQIPFIQKSILSFIAILILYLGISPQEFLSICFDVASLFLEGAKDV